MKKITLFFVSLFTLLHFSSTYAEEWYIEQLLDLNYGIEQYELDLRELDYIYFNDSKYNYVYNELKRVDSILKTEFMNKYRSWEYEYYQTNGIVTNYNNFIYHTNKFFFYLKMKESNPNYWEINTAILHNYRSMKSSYSKVKNIVKW